MFRRLFWLVMGAAFGFGVAFFLMRWLRATAERYAPERVRGDVAQAMRDLGSDIRSAVADGRAAMREREAEIRADLGERPTERAAQADRAEQVELPANP